MRKEDFLYQYLVKFNEYEKNDKDRNMVSYWKSQENDGLIFNALRNILCHSVRNCLEHFTNYISFDEILYGLTTLELDYKKRLKLIEFLLNTTNIESEFNVKGFIKSENITENNSYMFFYKKYKNITSTIFFHNDAQFVSCSVSSFDHENNQRNLFDSKYCLEAEYYNDYILFKIWNYEQEINLKPYLEFRYMIKKGNKGFKSFDDISYSVMKDDIYLEYTTINKSPSEYTKVIKKHSVKELATQHFNFETIETIASKVKDYYNELNGFLHKIGLKDSSLY